MRQKRMSSSTSWLAPLSDQGGELFALGQRERAAAAFFGDAESDGEGATVEINGGLGQGGQVGDRGTGAGPSGGTDSHRDERRWPPPVGEQEVGPGPGGGGHRSGECAVGGDDLRAGGVRE